MGKKVFISYKYSDTDVASFKELSMESSEPTKVRDYVTKLQEVIGEEHVNKGEKDDESLEEFKDDTIQGKLADKIFDSTVTIVLISPNMKDTLKAETEQWIPWEISYSLKDKNRKDKSGKIQRSPMNAVLAVILPDKKGNYEYYIKENICSKCGCINLKTNMLFEILSKNMFNIKEPSYSNCSNHDENSVYIGDPSYIISVKWCDFIKNVNYYIERSLAIKDKNENYNIVKKPII
ncbi:TIR domain-containing protein [Proteus mirabilis]|uniref:TIR domain-containing protein n=1 Tax=Proteus mirabilis TaxID=584 RepID=UPI0003083C2F|nr:TIR domain-containing protein [Proteus mirabilis]